VRSGAGLLIVAVLWLAGLALAQATNHAGERVLYNAEELTVILRHSPMPPVPPDPTDRVADDSRAVKFGQYLFFDAHLSGNGSISCATCHEPARAFTDGKRVAQALGTGTRHTPSLLGAAYNQWYFWDGRTDSQWSQALHPFENRLEMGTTRRHVVDAVLRDRAARAAYERIFGAPPPLARPNDVDRVYSNIGKAIEAYERKLIVGTSPFDRYLAALRAHDVAGESVISPAAKRGLKLFVGAANCELCHSGPDFTDGQFHNIGLPLQPGEVADRGRADGIRQVLADRFDGTGPFSDAPRGSAHDRLAFLPQAESQVGAFKTPSLRNVARVAPYMHDGRFSTLAGVLDFYSRGAAVSRGRLVGKRESTLDLIPHLTKRQQSDLIAFLQTLTDAPLSAELTRAPATP
jgi:cytochrome c peroxidase